MSLLQISVRPETRVFQIEKMNCRRLRRLRARGLKGVFEKAARCATSDHDPIRLFLLSSSNELTKISPWIACEAKRGRGDRKKQPLGVKRQCPPAVTEEESPISRHAWLLSHDPESVNFERCLDPDSAVQMRQRAIGNSCRSVMKLVQAFFLGYIHQRAIAGMRRSNKDILPTD